MTSSGGVEAAQTRATGLAAFTAAGVSATEILRDYRRRVIGSYPWPEPEAPRVLRPRITDMRGVRRG